MVSMRVRNEIGGEIEVEEGSDDCCDEEGADVE